jgi:ribosomal protein S7
MWGRTEMKEKKESGMKSIKISNEIYEKLNRITGIYMMQTGKRVPISSILDEALKLLEERIRNQKSQ